VAGAPFLVGLGALSSPDVRGIRRRASVQKSPENTPIPITSHGHVDTVFILFSSSSISSPS